MANLASQISIPPDVIFRDLDGEAIILNTESGRYYSLDPVGTRFWLLLTRHGRVEPAYRTLLTEYDVSEQELRTDILDLLDELASHGLLHIDG